MVIESQGISMLSVVRGIIGITTIIGIAWLFSTNRKKVHWATIGKGLLFQLILALGVLYVPFVQAFFEYGGKVFVLILDFTKQGSEFLMGDLVDLSKTGYIFMFQILPTIIFFSALTSLLFYLGVIQKIVYGLAWIMSRFLKLSGAESLSVAGNIFLGQTESPLMIKAFLEKMNRSEIFLVMTGGMATIAGGVMAAYIGFLGGDDPALRQMFAKHLLTASVMAAPGAVVLSKILFPQTEDIDKNIEISKDKVGTNILDAISNGTVEGIKLAVNVGGMLLVFIAFIAMFNYFTNNLIGRYTGLNEVIARITDNQYDGLSLQFMLGYVMSPFMWLIGVAKEDMTLVGQLLGEKVIINEFIGYASLGKMQAAGAFAYEKSIIMSTYILCGFANISSIGIQIGGIGSLAPGKKVWLSEFGFRALLAGTLASALSATFIGMIMG
ncbi:NupC/NupG family nucleoside CNT transporter [Saccharicrinis sp. FJH62]|uniref:NupC/NupG family nucleoside CNT transporter n=1 Tax=Saccharicrinis sp. FJH62 TaxID=3344657 RepID=UPI0035D3FC60